MLAIHFRCGLRSLENLMRNASSSLLHGEQTLRLRVLLYGPDGEERHHWEYGLKLDPICLVDIEAKHWYVASVLPNLASRFICTLLTCVMNEEGTATVGLRRVRPHLSGTVTQPCALLDAR